VTYAVPGEVYDRVYTSPELGKDYDAEAAHLLALARERVPGARTLLDVCCGTGLHLARLRGELEVEGVDHDPALLRTAAERNPGVPLHEGDLFALDLGRSFDVVTCLFSSVSYARTPERLDLALAGLARHVSPGGLLVIEHLLAPEDVEDGRLASIAVQEPGLVVQRTILTRLRGEREGSFHMHYLVGRPAGIAHYSEEHRFGSFTPEQVLAAIARTGLEPEREAAAGGFARPLYLGQRAPA